MKKEAKQVDFLTKCSVCEAQLDPVNMIILEEQDQKTTMHVSCAKCNSSVLIFVSNNQAGILSIGVATDLDGSEVKEKFGNQNISADDILDLHQFVCEDRGDLMQILRNN